MASLLILFLPTVFLGAIFPLAAQLFEKEKEDIIGLVYASDLVGAIFGSLTAGFWLIPLYGNKITATIAAGINLLSAIIILPGKRKLVPAVIIMITAVLVIFYPSIFSGQNGRQFYKSSAFGIVKVENNILYIDSKGMCEYKNPEENGLMPYTMESFKS